MNFKEHRRKILRKLNFKQTGGTKHEKWTLRDSSTGKLYITTYVSRGNKDIGAGLMKAICAQAAVGINVAPVVRYPYSRSIRPDPCRRFVFGG